MPDALALDYWLKVFQIIGIPVAIFVYGLNKRKERLEREYGTYNALDERYIDYLKLCMDHPDLDVGDIQRTVNGQLTEEQQHRELVMFSILISIMERAYLMYRDKSDELRRTQWEGWSTYISDWCGRPNFAKAVPTVAQQFDKRFCAYLLDVADPKRGKKP